MLPKVRLDSRNELLRVNGVRFGDRSHVDVTKLSRVGFGYFVGDGGEWRRGRCRTAQEQKKPQELEQEQEQDWRAQLSSKSLRARQTVEE